MHKTLSSAVHRHDQSPARYHCSFHALSPLPTRAQGPLCLPYPPTSSQQLLNIPLLPPFLSAHHPCLSGSLQRRRTLSPIRAVVLDTCVATPSPSSHLILRPPRHKFNTGRPILYLLIPLSVLEMPSATSTRAHSISRISSACINRKTSLPLPIASSLSSSTTSLAHYSGTFSSDLTPVLPCQPVSFAYGSPTSACVPESPIAHKRRAPSPAHIPPMDLQSTPAQHTLTVLLPEGLAPEMVTVSAKKGARLAVVADLWHREDDSHYEWQVVFSPADVDMMSVRALFEAKGELKIRVPRRAGGECSPPPVVLTQ